jgi:hypothetical protein
MHCHTATPMNAWVCVEQRQVRRSRYRKAEGHSIHTGIFDLSLIRARLQGVKKDLQQLPPPSLESSHCTWPQSSYNTAIASKMLKILESSPEADLGPHTSNYSPNYVLYLVSKRNIPMPELRGAISIGSCNCIFMSYVDGDSLSNPKLHLSYPSFTLICPKILNNVKQPFHQFSGRPRKPMQCKILAS